MTNYEKDIQAARTIAEQVAKKGGAVYYVGGFVRDKLAGRENKDVDIEVHGIRPKELEEILDSLGQRLTIGESFGIYGLKGYSLDIAMPRKETMRGQGHRDFDICVDPFIGLRGAALRRDFTVNALMENVLTGETVDLFGGIADLQAGILRHINSETFAEDPLRVLRGAQFAARFGFTVAPETVALCRKMPLCHLPRERIMGELEKALLKAERPSVFFAVLREMDQLGDWFPEVQALIGVEQNTNYHTEGDVWNHTMLVLDEVAALRSRVENPLGLMLSALCHDFGKIVGTTVTDGVAHAYGHEIKGLPLVERFMKRLTGETALIRYVLNLAEFHMKPNMMAAAGSALKATNKLFDSVEEPSALIALSIADGKGTLSPKGYISHEEFLQKRLEIYREYMARPYVMGRDLIEAGLRPGKEFSAILTHAHKLRLAGVSKKNALRQCLAMANKKRFD